MRTLNIRKKFKNEFSSLKEFTIFKKSIGMGGYARVYRVQHKVTLKIYALKLIRLANLNELEYENIEKEIEALIDMDHKHVNRLRAYFVIEDKVYLILDYCSRGNLFNHLKQKVLLSDAQLGRICVQMLLGLQYIHE